MQLKGNNIPGEKRIPITVEIGNENAIKLKMVAGSLNMTPDELIQELLTEFAEMNKMYDTKSHKYIKKWYVLESEEPPICENTCAGCMLMYFIEKMGVKYVKEIYSTHQLAMKIFKTEEYLYKDELKKEKSALKKCKKEYVSENNKIPDLVREMMGKYCFKSVSSFMKSIEAYLQMEKYVKVYDKYLKEIAPLYKGGDDHYEDMLRVIAWSSPKRIYRGILGATTEYEIWIENDKWNKVEEYLGRVNYTVHEVIEYFAKQLNMSRRILCGCREDENLNIAIYEYYRNRRKETDILVMQYYNFIKYATCEIGDYYFIEEMATKWEINGLENPYQEYIKKYYYYKANMKSASRDLNDWIDKNYGKYYDRAEFYQEMQLFMKWYEIKPKKRPCYNMV